MIQDDPGLWIAQWVFLGPHGRFHGRIPDLMLLLAPRWSSVAVVLRQGRHLRDDGMLVGSHVFSCRSRGDVEWKNMGKSWKIYGKPWIQNVSSPQFHLNQTWNRWKVRHLLVAYWKWRCSIAGRVSKQEDNWYRKGWRILPHDHLKNNDLEKWTNGF